MPGMDKSVEQKAFRQAGAELRELTDQHPALKHPIAQEHLQAWIEAQQNDESPEALCAKLAKTIVELAALFQAHHETLSDEQVQETLRRSLQLWEEQRADRG